MLDQSHFFPRSPQPLSPHYCVCEGLRTQMGTDLKMRLDYDAKAKAVQEGIFTRSILGKPISNLSSVLTERSQEPFDLIFENLQPRKSRVWVAIADFLLKSPTLDTYQQKL